MQQKPVHRITEAELRAARDFLLGLSDELAPPTARVSAPVSTPPGRFVRDSRKVRSDVPFHQGITRARARATARPSV